MPAVTVRRPGRGGSRSHPHAVVTSSAGSVMLGATDEKVDYSGLGSTWVEVPRPGDNSLARRATRNRLRARVSAMLIQGYGGLSIHEQMLALDRIGASSATCGVSFGEMAEHRWHLIEATLPTIDREQITNRTKHADVTLTFLVAVDEQIKVALSRKRSQPGDKGKVKRHTVVVRKGDTLSKIAARELGNANRWPEIAKLNGIRNPKSIRTGQKLRVGG